MNLEDGISIEIMPWKIFLEALWQGQIGMEP
jgi:hypothetical protein